MEDWLDVEVNCRRQPAITRSRPKKKDRDPRISRRIQPQHTLQDDRAETYDPYSCYTCNTCTCCCRCPDPRPITRVPAMYVIDAGDRTVRRLTYNETIGILHGINHDMYMESYIGRSPWKGLQVDRTAWYPGPLDPLHTNYEKPKFTLDRDDDY